MDILIALDALDELLHRARRVPFSPQVRVDGEKLRRLVDDVHTTLPPRMRDRAQAEGLLERLDAAVGDAQAVPLTPHLRIHRDARDELRDVVSRLTVIAGETRGT